MTFSTEYVLSDDPSKQFEIDGVIEHKTQNKQTIPIVDTPAGKVLQLHDYFAQGGHEVYKELQITPVAFSSNCDFF